MNKVMNTLFKEPKKIYIRIVVLVVVSFFINEVEATILDSIGIEKKEGKIFVLHKVEVKETLYSISRKYSAKVEDIKAANTDLKADISIGQILRIPYKGTIPSTNPSSSSNFKIHTVEKKETLYSISKLYSISVETLLKANQGADAGLKEGQELKIPVNGNTTIATPAKVVEEPIVKANTNAKVHVVELKETLFGISKKYDVSVDAIKKANPQLIDGLKEGMELIIPTDGPSSDISTPIKTNISTETTTQGSSKEDFKKITEKGNAELFDSAKDSPKFQALHKSAPIGTIIQVTNESNNQKIFVRVVGKFTSTTDAKTILKLSQKAMDRLEVKEGKVAVILTYIP